MVARHSELASTVRKLFLLSSFSIICVFIVGDKLCLVMLLDRLVFNGLGGFSPPGDLWLVRCLFVLKGERGHLGFDWLALRYHCLLYISIEARASGVFEVV